MATFISVQLKKTSEVDLAKPLVKFIQQMYPSGGEEQAQYCRAAEELSKLRRAALGRPLDKHEGALETLLRWAWAGRGRSAARRPSLPRSGPSARPRPRRCGPHTFLVSGRGPRADARPASVSCRLAPAFGPSASAEGMPGGNGVTRTDLSSHINPELVSFTVLGSLRLASTLSPFLLHLKTLLARFRFCC